MAVSFLGNALAGKKTQTTTVTYDTANNGITAYAVKLDNDGNPTSEVWEFGPDRNMLTVNITGTDKVFEGVEVEDKEENKVYENIINVNSGNAKISYSIFGIESEEGNASFVIDSKDGSESVLVLYVGEDDFYKLAAAQVLDGTVNMNSTLEVERIGFKYFTIIIGVLFVIFTVITCVVIKEKSSVEMQTASVGQMFKALIQNDQAMAIVETIVLVNVAVYITSNLLIYFFKYDLGGSNWQGNYTLFNMFIGGVQIIAMMVFFPLLRKFFKIMKLFYYSCYSAVAGYLILLGMSLAGVRNVYVLFIPGFFIMAAVGMINVMVTVFLANTVDYGELKNNRRDESVIFSMQTFVVKLASGIAALVASICLTVFNIQEDSAGAATVSMMVRKINALITGEGATIDDSAVIGLRLVMTLAPVIVLAVAMYIHRTKYILTDKKLEEITAELKKR
ncbi:MAG: MFS transporter [Clostridiales bacterium]|nr:MFS transporter [Clostridiales bacterium]